MDLKELNFLNKKLDRIIKQITLQDYQLFTKKEKEIPKGWVSIEKHLPVCSTIDFLKKEYTPYKVKDKNGDIFECGVGEDSLVWYSDVKTIGVEYWWND